MKDIFVYLIFPGFLFTVLLGMLASWLDRKITARVQWRVGPPWYQSFADLIKLLAKETIIPRGCSRATFILAPIMGFAGVILTSSILGMINLNPHQGFIGDMIVVIYLLMVPALAMIMGGIASGNALSSLGASREMKLMIAYELPFILAAFTPVIKAGMTIDMGGLLEFQQAHGVFLRNYSCIIAFLVALLCMQAKVGFVPFDIAEAETEINAGPFIEYSGALLAIFKVTKMMLLVLIPTFLLTLFAGGIGFCGWRIGASVLKYLIILLIMIVIKNTNPRLRIDQALKFFWGPVTVLALLGMVLALLGY